MYTDYFGFTDKPFNVSPDPKFLYLSGKHQEALASMFYGIQEKKGFISVIGEVGTGKTTLLRSLLNDLDEKTETVLLFNTNVTFEHLLKNILWDLNIPTHNECKLELIQLLNMFLLEKHSTGGNVALIIDEAQNLSPEVLEEFRMLSNLETEKEKLLQIVLVGQPELNAKLKSPDLRQLTQRIGINCYLTPLNHEDIVKYISHRLTVAGCRDNHLFSKKAINLICKHSGGIPRIINILCDNALLLAFGADRKRIDEGMVKEVIADYERRDFPIQDEEATNVSATPPIFLKRLTRSWAFNLSLLSLVVLFLAVGISAYGSKANSLDQLMNTLFTTFTSRWQTVENPLNNEPANNSMPQPSKILSLSDSPSIEEDYSKVAIKKKEFVSTLALREYGMFNDTIHDILKRSNPQIEDLAVVSEGQEIFLPPLDVESTIVETDGGGYAVHIATLRSYNQARKYFDELGSKAYPVSILPVKITGEKPWYRITMGNFSNHEQAIAYARSINFDKLPIIKNFPFTAEAQSTQSIK